MPAGPGLIEAKIVPEPRVRLALPRDKKGRLDKERMLAPPDQWDYVAPFATQLSMHWDLLGALPRGTRARTLDRLLRSMLALMREKPRSSSQTRGKAPIVRAMYLAKCDTAGEALNKAQFAREVAPELHVDPSTIAGYLKGCDWSASG